MRALCTFSLIMTEIPRPTIDVNIGDFSLKLRALKKAMGAKNNQALADLLSVPNNTIGNWIRETNEPRLQIRRALEKKIEDEMLRLRIAADEPPTPPNPFPDGPPPPTEPEDAPEPAGSGPVVRSLLPDDRRWDV